MLFLMPTIHRLRKICWNLETSLLFSTLAVVEFLSLHFLILNYKKYDIILQKTVNFKLFPFDIKSRIGRIALEKTESDRSINQNKRNCICSSISS